MEIKKEEFIKKTIIIGYICDGCKKKIELKDAENWLINFNYNHLSWGNDSIDSYKYFDACSPVCLAKIIKETLGGEEYDGEEIADMPREFAINLAKSILKSN